MKNIYIIYVLALFVFSCGGNETKPLTQGPRTQRIKSNSNKKSETTTNNELKSFDKKNVVNVKQYDNGVRIKWFQSLFKKNPTLKDDEVVLINYRLSLPDGKIFDGNNRIEMPFIPFIVGYNMKTEGWDFALKNLKVGDFAKVEIPASLAYGTKGLGSIVPPNSDVWLYVKVIAKVSPDKNDIGVKTWTFEKGISSKYDESDEKEITYHAIASAKSNPVVLNTHIKHFPLTYIPGQKNVVPGLRKVLKNAKKGQKIFVLLKPEQAYGSKGFGNLVAPNESIFYNITIEDVRGI
jgi:FKBP-type peptidyl-prolyl cis-trans isomerase